jgi:hypothetical protein
MPRIATSRLRDEVATPWDPLAPGCHLSIALVCVTQVGRATLYGMARPIIDGKVHPCTDAIVIRRLRQFLGALPPTRTVLPYLDQSHRVCATETKAP